MKARRKFGPVLLGVAAGLLLGLSPLTAMAHATLVNSAPEPNEAAVGRRLNLRSHRSTRPPWIRASGRGTRPARSYPAKGLRALSPQPPVLFRLEIRKLRSARRLAAGAFHEVCCPGYGDAGPSCRARLNLFGSSAPLPFFSCLGLAQAHDGAIYQAVLSKLSKGAGAMNTS